MSNIARREPLTFAVGDSLIFNKYLADYLPSAGWSLLYEVRQGAAGNAPVSFASTPDATNTIHQINVPSATTSAWLPGDLILVGYAVNASGERHQIYYGEFELTPNLGTQVDNVPVLTHAQQMIAALEASTLELAAHTINDSDIQQVEIRRARRKELREELAFWREVRANEVALENVRNGRPSGQKIIPQMNVMTPRPSLGFSRAWPFNT